MIEFEINWICIYILHSCFSVMRYFLNWGKFVISNRNIENIFDRIDQLTLKIYIEFQIDTVESLVPNEMKISRHLKLASCSCFALTVKVNKYKLHNIQQETTMFNFNRQPIHAKWFIFFINTNFNYSFFPIGILKSFTTHNFFLHLQWNSTAIIVARNILSTFPFLQWNRFFDHCKKKN